MSELPVGGMSFAGEEPAAVLDLPGEERDIRAGGNLRYEVSAELTGGCLMVRGWILMSVWFRCSRCDEWFETTLWDRKFEREYGIAGREACVDLTPDMRESMILAFPAQPLCRESCKGLCAKCGHNLNVSDCGCAARPDELRWRGLAGLDLQ